MINRIGALAVCTFRETVRDRIFYLVAVFGFVMLASTAVLSPLTVGAQGKIMADVGLASMNLIGLLVVVFVGTGMVRKELDKGTILTIMSKPVGRREYLLGKFIGLNFTLFCMLVVMGIIFLLMTFLAPGNFSLRYIPVFYLTFLELMLVNAVAIFFSTCVSPILAAVFTLGAFIVGHLSQSIRDLGEIQGTVLQQKISTVVYYLIPNLEVFNVRAEVVHGMDVTFDLVAMATIYGLGWVGLLLVIGGAVFAGRELR